MVDEMDESIINRKKHKGKRHSVVLTQPITEKIERMAENEKRSISQVIARLVEIGLENTKAV
jgi:predicted DNA-binding ribbon-helix-helix protein